MLHIYQKQMKKPRSYLITHVAGKNLNTRMHYPNLILQMMPYHLRLLKKLF